VLLLQIGSVSFDRQGVADHASQLANNIQGNLKRSLEGLGVVRADDRHTAHCNTMASHSAADGMLTAAAATAQALPLSV
jgi:dihydrolipoamide dehydrogenase